ncbi:quorum-sensing sensor histidine kinase AgrC [Staphylococcus coagulans]|uniref:quorum-sensing sensor histidine kinase AgrC n=1 Tax=Staphylococcus coagulans TaxID=74706 RepID=UPI001BE82229|nr:GHKL domain-containing protein [Staphylococcus coagulans]MBT2810593.1 GHKL domain-containing protein [Staphylococcus coagulans]MBT2822027.1 GHKL domain-containing protein [Staphylococcus coagulans]MBT2862988.1 GHKL domain-containing protein [Staphylococcus coagulans]
MGIVGVIFINLFQAFVFASIASIIQKYKYTKRDYVLIFIGIVIPSMVFYFLFERYSLFYLIFAFFIFYYKRLKIIGVLSVLVTVIVLILSNFISSWAYAYMSTLNVNFYTANVFYAIIFVLCCYLFSIILVFLFNKFKLSWLHLNKLYLSILIAFLATVFYVFFFLTPKSVASFNEFKSIGTFYFLLFSAIAILIFMTTITIAREISYRHKKQEAEDYYKYTLEMEKVNNRMRKFRHDYINILATMSEYLREDDLEGLKEYYHNNISPLKGHFETNSLKLNGIEKLKVREIKGVITTKILSAQENNIEISVEVADEITSINMEIIDLSRVLGIIMDNAIEASLTVEDPMIQIAFIKTETSVLIIIMNKAPKNMPKLHTLFQEGFSTKGKNRGIGLSTLKEITDKTENVLLDTTIENQYFIQKIEVMNDDD